MGCPESLSRSTGPMFMYILSQGPNHPRCRVGISYHTSYPLLGLLSLSTGYTLSPFLCFLLCGLFVGLYGLEALSDNEETRGVK